MKDKIVMSVISKIYLIIGSLLSFIFISLIVVFIILQHGLYLDNLSISNVTVKNLYIKWNEKLNVSIDELSITTIKREKANHFNIDDIGQYITLSSQFFLLTESVVIEKFIYNDTIISLKHSSDENGFITANSPSVQFQSYFKFQDKKLLFTITNFSTINKHSTITGKIVLDPHLNKIYSKLNVIVNNDANLTLYAIADKEHLQYALKSNQDIQHIHELVALFNLPKAIHFWTIDAINAKSVTINKINGFIDYHNLSNAYKNIHVLATVNKLDYTYNTKLDAIHTQRTELEFLNGILNIRPKKAFSYNMYLGSSWLKIDFTKRQELLTLYLLFDDGILNKDILNILSTYHIKLPFLQHSGKISTNLTLVVNLKTIKINATGKFYTKKANFDYLGLNIDIEDTLIKLNNYDVAIPQMKAHYKNIANANVTVRYNTKQATGKINFIFDKIHINNQQYLNTKNRKFHATYVISPNGDIINAEKSIWNLNNFEITFDPLKLPFDLKNLEVTIPTTYFSVKGIADGFITAKANIKDLTTNIKADLLHFKYTDIKLEQSNTPLDIQYNKKLSIKSKRDIFFSISGSPYKINNLNLEFNTKNITLKNTKLYVSNYITTQIQANYHIKDKRADILLHNTTLINPKNKKRLYYKKNLNIILQHNNKNIKISSKELNADFLLLDDRWILKLNSLSAIARNSDFLRKYNLNDGKIKLYKKNEDKYTNFLAEINYKYKILTDLNKPIEYYKITGYITKKQVINATVNKNLTLKIADNININLQDSGISSEELLKFIKFLSTVNTNKDKNTNNLKFTAINSYIYLGHNRYVLADTMSLQYYKNIVTAQLQYQTGTAGFKFKDRKFHLYGQNFNDNFMEKLFTLSKFKGGSLDFSINGDFSDYEGTFFIKNTVIQDYIILNNVLAFINTVPSLATFSLPGYTKNGLLINNAYMKFHLKDHIFDISDIYIGSKEIKIFGQGKASVKYNNIDITLGLKTDIAKNLSKIPVVGYLIFDGKTLSTTLKITGKLTDPKVQTMLARDVVAAPLNIIQRTLTLPYHLLKDVSKLKDSNK